MHEEQLEKGGTILHYSQPGEVKVETRRDRNLGKQSTEEKAYDTRPLLETDGNDEKLLKKLSKRLRDSAGKLGKSETVRGIIEIAGDKFPELVKLGTDGNFTKNALHLAAWKGDLESIELLVEAGNQHGLDLVNVISTGQGNYGKTPIFYAITQDRDDAVRLFLVKGANLLLVNNKGQTPCSMSVSHLQPETCQLMYEKEYEQIRSGAKFQNYRLSHGDNMLYGDLDPRFEIDIANYGVDLAAGMQDFRDVQELAMGHEGASEQTCYRILPLSFQPRALRVTTKQSRQSCAGNFKREHSLCARKIKHSKLPPAREILGSSLEEKKQSEMMGRKMPAKNSEEAELQSPYGTGLHKEEDISKLPRLYLNDLPVGATTDAEKLRVTVIDNESLIADLAKEVSLTLALLERQQSGPNDKQSYNGLIEVSWGLDCEWKPSKDRGRENPVATLQLSSCRRSFLIDCQLLCQGAVQDPLAPMSSTEEALCETLNPIFLMSVFLSPALE